MPKQDLVEAAMAFNTIGGTVEESFVNIGLLRTGTEGSSSWFGIFTVMPNHIHGDERRLTYDIREGDVLVVGDFDPGKGDIVAVHRAGVNADGLRAEQVASPEGRTPGGDRIWGDRETNSDIVAAINTTETELGEDGELFDGTDATGHSIPRNRLTRDGDLEPGAFFETAIPLEIFLEDGLCGDVFHGSFITRPSRSRSSALKDLIHPFQLNLGEVDPQAALTPTCDGDLEFGADPLITDVPTILSNSVPSPECTWSIECNGDEIFDEPHVNDCSEELLSEAMDNDDFPLDSADASVVCEASVHVESAEAPGCVGEDDDDTTVYPPLSVSAQLTPTCEDPGVENFVSSFGFEATDEEGGTGDHTYDWQFADPDDTDISDSDESSGEVLVRQAGPDVDYTATLTLTDDGLDEATGDECEATVTETTTPLAPLDVELELEQEPAQCDPQTELETADQENLDEVTFDASVSGGTGSYSWEWTPDAFCDDIDDPVEQDTDSCTIDPDPATQFCGTTTVEATIEDDSADRPALPTCESADTQQGTYTKETIIEAQIE